MLAWLSTACQRNEIDETRLNPTGEPALSSVETESPPTLTRQPKSEPAVTSDLGEIEQPPSPTLTTAPTDLPTGTPAPTDTITSTPEPTSTPVPDFPLYEGPALNRSELGTQIHLHREDLDALIEHMRVLGVGWVKVQVSWKIYQPEAGRYDDFRLDELDRLVEAAAANDIQVMLGVAKAPEWSRPTTDQDGPPSDFGNFQAFMNFLAGRYQGRVAAYELWNEPNLQREWTGFPLDAVSLVELLRAGAAGVRAADPEAVLISAAPATTGINDGVTAIDDRVFLQQMVAAGLPGVVDAIGAHPYGWANPPDSTASSPDPAVPSHNNHPSFFYLDTLQDYRAILDRAGYPDKPIWVTEFGWGSYDGMGVPAPEGVAYMSNVNEWQQATYTLRAYEMAHERDWVDRLFYGI